MPISNKELSFPFKNDPKRSSINIRPNGDPKGYDTLYKIKNHDFIIRQRDLEDRYSSLSALVPDGYSTASEDEKREIATDIARQLKKIFLRLPKYGIETAFHNIVVGKNNQHENVVFIHTDLIGDAQDVYLDEDIAATPELQREKFKLTLQRTISGLVSYFIDSLQSGEIFMDDLPGLGQFVFGKKPSDTEPNLYLTDIDARYLNNVDGEGLRRGNLYLSGLARTIKTAEKNGLDCSDDKKRLLAFYQSHPEQFSNLDDFDRKKIASLQENI